MQHRPFGQHHAMLAAQPHFTGYLKLWHIVSVCSLFLCLVSCSQPPPITWPVITPPSARSTSTPHPTLKPTPTPLPSPTPTPVLTPTLSANNPLLYDDFVKYYFQLVTSHQLQQAYQQLSPQLQASEPYSDFVNNPNYTLSSGCWTIVQIPVSQQEKDGSTWNVGVELAYTSCTSNTTIFFYWNFHIAHGHLVIVRIGLYPTEVNN